jgi:glycerol-3-phosphate dehydrogenase
VDRSPLANRQAALARLADEPWDVLIVGGGIVGSGALLDATTRGLKAALIEQDDLAVGTSSRSSRLIHGGLRYLEDLRLPLVREALSERARLLRLAPHLVHLERFLFPLYGWPLVQRAYMGAGFALYDLLGAARDGGRARHLSADAVAGLAPGIRRAGLRGGITYADGVEDDARFSLGVARTAMMAGATVVTRARVTGLRTDRSGAIAGIRVHDQLDDVDLDVRSRRVIDATGAWLADPETRLGGSEVSLVPSRGSHLVFARERLPLAQGLTIRVPGRVVFVIPSPGVWIVGTTDTAMRGAPDRPVPTQAEVAQILANVNRVLEADLRPSDAVGAFAGLRPLVGVPGADTDTARVSREHTIHREASGLVRVSGGKYTTYRLMARDAVDAVLEGEGSPPPSRTHETRLVGADARGRLDRLAQELVERTGLEQAVTTALVGRHGTRASEVVALGQATNLLRPLVPGRTELEAEVAWAVEDELALSLDDILSRRLRLAMSLPDRGAAVAGRTARIAGERLGWDAERQALEIRRYLETAHREYDVPGLDGKAGPGAVR